MLFQSSGAEKLVMIPGLQEYNVGIHCLNI